MSWVNKEYITMHEGGQSCEPFEYFCNSCGQMRLSFVMLSSCGNCYSANIVKGQPHELDREALRKAFEDRRR